VALTARALEDLELVAAEVRGVGERALVVPGDLASADVAERVVSSAVDAFGRIDVLVNAAGTDVPGPVAELPTEAWDRVMQVNLRAPFLLGQAAFRHMRAAGRGTIVNVSSVAGKRGWANAAAYCASKFALTGLTQAFAAEARAHGIRVCVLYPGAMDTSWGTWSPVERREAHRDAPPRTQALAPERVAELIVWIAAAPPELVLNEVVVSPLEEEGWP
jgi:NAD(P)-dependent dehydrogenase (short-subunit alcohol dehydrogenase family)